MFTYIINLQSYFVKRKTCTYVNNTKDSNFIFTEVIESTDTSHRCDLTFCTICRRHRVVYIITRLILISYIKIYTLYMLYSANVVLITLGDDTFKSHYFSRDFAKFSNCDPFLVGPLFFDPFSPNFKNT